MSSPRRPRRVLAAIDFSDHAETAARVAYAIAARNGADLMLLHVHEGVVGSDLLPTTIADELDATAIDVSRQRLEALAESLRSVDPSPLPVAVELRPGRPRDVLVQAAHDWDASILVLGSRGRSRVASWLLGSVSRELSAAAPCPVLITRSGITKGFHGSFERATIGVDHSAASRPLIESTAGVMADDGRIDLVHALAVPSFLVPTDSDSNTETAAATRALTADALAWAATRLAKVRDDIGLTAGTAGAAVEVGRAAPTLIAHAEATGADLIALGSHSRDNLADRVLGTTADRVLRHATVPVLVLPTAALDVVRIAPRGAMATFEQLGRGPCKSYLIAANNHEAMLVDPVLDDVEAILAKLATRGLELVYVIDTHIHSDHLSGAPQLTARTGATYVVHEKSATEHDALRVSEGQTLALGELEATIMHTPGHTPDSMTLVFPDRLLPGDFLFIGPDGAGRTDLPGGDPGAYWDSLRKLDSLGGDLLIFPGHVFGSKRFSTLGAERHDNPRLRPRTREGYIAWLRSVALEGAAWMVDVMSANRACRPERTERTERKPSRREPP